MPPVCLKWPNNSPSRTTEQEPARLLVPSLNVSRPRSLRTIRRSLRGLFDRPSLPRLGSVARYHDRSKRELTRAKRRALKRHLLRTTPLPALLLLRTWRSTWETLTGRPNASVGRGGQGAKSGPKRQQAAPVAVQGRPSGPLRGNGNHQIPNPDNRPNLSLHREQRKAEVDQRLAAPNGTRPTRWNQPPVQAPRRSPPRRDIRRSPERTLDNSRRRQRTPSPVDRRARPDDSKLLGFVAGALELIKERVLHQ
jgi:hypothetical protein